MTTTREHAHFAYSPDGGLETFDNEDDARQWAEAEIDTYRDTSTEGWSQAVEEVCWGEVRQFAAKGPESPPPEGSSLDFICDYTLTDA